MKKRILALTVAFVMLLAMVPAAGAETPMDITETGLYIFAERNGNDGPTSSATYQAGAGTLEWDLSTLTLTLNNATINAINSTNAGNALQILSGLNHPEVTVVLNGDSAITGKDYSTSSYGIQSGCPLKFTGSGTLTVSGGSVSNGASTGITCFGLTVEQGATVTAVAGSGSANSSGVSSSGLVTVAGTLNATSESGIGLHLSSGGVDVQEGGTLKAQGRLTYSTNSYGINFNGSTRPVTVKGTLIAIGFAPFGKTISYQNDVIVKGSNSADGTDLTVYTNPTSFECNSYANNPKYIMRIKS